MVVAVELTGDEADLWRSQQRIIEQAGKLEGKYKKVAKSAGRAGKAANQSFGSGAVSKLGRYLAGVVSITAALGVVRKGLVDIRDVRLKAAGQIGTEEEGLKRLIQISGGDKARFADFKATAVALQTERGFGPAEALKLVFEGVSLGLSTAEVRDAGKFKGFAANISPLIQAGAGIRAAFGESALGGTLDSAINALLAGAEASKVDVTQLSSSVLGPAQAVKRLGGTAAETVAAVATAAVALKSVEEAETAISRLADVLVKDRRFKGKGLVESIEILAGLTERQRDLVIGENVRARRGAGVLIESLEKLKSTLASVDEAVAATGTKESRINQALRLSGSDVKLANLTIKQRAVALQTVAETGEFGSEQLQRDAIFAAVRADLTDKGAGFFERLAVNTEIALADFFGTAPGKLIGRITTAEGELRAVGIDIHRQDVGGGIEVVTAHLKAILDSTENNTEAVNRGNELSEGAEPKPSQVAESP